MKRSGQHAIINWLCEQGRPALHFNACDHRLEPRNFIVEYNDGKEIHHKDDFQPLLKNYKLVIYNFEDVPVYDTGMKRLIIIRDPWNWKASRRKSRLALRDDIWKQHALHPTSKVLFNYWVKDVEYRKNLCKSLSIHFTDAGFDEVFWHGKSHFDNMDVLERYKEVKVTVSPEMEKLWREIQ
jgi:hypothetical protein